MTVNDVLNYNSIIKNIIDGGMNISNLVKFKMLGMLKQFEPIVQNVETIRNEQITKFGTTNENGVVGVFEPIKENFENADEYDKAVKEYEDTIKKLTEAMNEVIFHLKYELLKHHFQ